MRVAASRDPALRRRPIVEPAVSERGFAGVRTGAAAGAACGSGGSGGSHGRRIGRRAGIRGRAQGSLEAPGVPTPDEERRKQGGEEENDDGSAVHACSRSLGADQRRRKERITAVMLRSS
jgi:hypothetical protein